MMSVIQFRSQFSLIDIIVGCINKEVSSDIKQTYPLVEKMFLKLWAALMYVAIT